LAHGPVNANAVALGEGTALQGGDEVSNGQWR